MFLYIPNHIYLGYYNEEIIILDLKADKYYILNEILSTALEASLQNEFIFEQGKYYVIHNDISRTKIFSIELDKALKRLIQLKIVSPRQFLCQNTKKVLRKSSDGAANIDWRMSYGTLDVPLQKRLIFEAYFILLRVHFMIKTLGFYRLIQIIKNKSKKSKHFILKSSEEFEVLVHALNRACFYFPKRTKCLEWSAALVLMALSRGWKCNLEIGVQNLPFSAHAWVALDGKIIADMSDLPEKLLVILSEPFPRKMFA